MKEDLEAIKELIIFFAKKKTITLTTNEDTAEKIKKIYLNLVEANPRRVEDKNAFITKEILEQWKN